MNYLIYSIQALISF